MHQALSVQVRQCIRDWLTDPERANDFTSISGLWHNSGVSPTNNIIRAEGANHLSDHHKFRATPDDQGDYDQGDYLSTGYPFHSAGPNLLCRLLWGFDAAD